jgi:hypothetical protein
MSFAEIGIHGKSWPCAVRSPKLNAYSNKHKIERVASEASRAGYSARYIRGAHKATKLDVLVRNYEQYDVIIDGDLAQVRSKPEVNVEQIFQMNAAKWKQDSMFTSSITQIVLHPSYQRIIGLGPAAIPYIIRDLEETGHQWFWALESITGANPIAPEDVGNPDAMTRQWSTWATQHGYK